MANETIGKIDHHCGSCADVRKNKNGRLYLSCPCCGLLAYGKQGGQDYILNNGRFYDAHGNMSNSEKDNADSVGNVIDFRKDAPGKYETVILENDDIEPPEKPPIRNEEKPVTKADSGIGSMQL